MSARNDITGDNIKTKPTSDKYRSEFDRIFNKNKDKSKEDRKD